MTLLEDDSALQTVIMPLAEKKTMLFSLERREAFYTGPGQAGRIISFPDTNFLVGNPKLENDTFIATVAGKYLFLLQGFFFHENTVYRCTIERRNSQNELLEESVPFFTTNGNIKVLYTLRKGFLDHP